MKKNFKLMILMLLASVYASAQDMQRLPTGIQYKIIGASGTKKVKLEDVITFNYVIRTDKDSVLRTAYGEKVQVQPSKNIGDLMDVFVLLAESDSAMIKVPTDSMFKEYEQGRPPFLPKGSYLNFSVKIAKIQSIDEANAEVAKMMEEMKMQEKASLASYIAANKLNLKTTPSGLMYLVTKPSVKPKPVTGDTVYVNYIGRTLDGHVFDTSIEAEAKKAGLDQGDRKYEPISLPVGEGAVIRGWDEGLLLFNEGAKGTLIIQSDLAYGQQGAGEAIRPFTPLVFDIELVKVKKPKKAVAATVKKPAPKPVAKTTAKPAAKAPAKPAPKPAAKAPVKK